jgi:hypothetical protein
MNKTNNVYETLIQEMNDIPYDFEEEVYYTKENGLSFSSPMTSNTWTREEDCIGRISSLPWYDLECFNKLDEEYVEIDDQCYERPRGFKRGSKLAEYNLRWEDSSVVKMSEAIERVASVYADNNAFEDITSEIDRIDNA